VTLPNSADLGADPRRAQLDCERARGPAATNGGRSGAGVAAVRSPTVSPTVMGLWLCLAPSPRSFYPCSPP
jgi:hypothetical protein